MNVCQSPKNTSVMEQNFADPFIKGRRKDWQQEVYKNSKVEDGGRQFCYGGDRFIPKRFSREKLEHNLKYIGRTVERDILKSSPALTSSYWRQNSFVSAINHMFGIGDHRLLQFGDPEWKAHMPLLEQRRRASMDGDWPCLPRTRPFAFPDATHDLPEFYRTFDYNLMDWSANDQIAVSFGQDVIIWRNRDETTMVFSVKRPRSLKYSPDGKYLAIGCMDCQYPVLELWEIQAGREFLVADGRYFQKYVDAICCLEWSKDSSEIVCGTTTGLIFVLSAPSMKTRRQLHKHKHSVSIMRFSPTMRYLATGDVEGNIYIFDGKSYQVILRLGSKVSCDVMFDWHPWTGVDLAVSEKAPSSIFIFHVPRREIVAFYQRKDKKIFINSINFSSITGELLVSISRRDEQGCPLVEILVLSSLNRVVDILSNQDRGSLFMMWSPDGSRLATAGLDESFSIWNFCPDHKKKQLVNRPSRAAVAYRSPLTLYGLLK